MAMSTMTTLATMSTMSANATVSSNSTVPVSGCFKVDPNWSHMFRPYDDKEYPWIGLWFSLPVTGIWYWCTDQVSKILNIHASYQIFISFLCNTFCYAILRSVQLTQGTNFCCRLSFKELLVQRILFMRVLGRFLQDS